MAPQYYYLTEKDRALLDRLATIFGGSVTPNRQHYLDDHIPKSPDVYIALVPEGGIPAATNNAGDAVPDFASGDKPGSLECDIYRIVDDELISTESKQLIYNLTSEQVNQGWIAVQREKFGLWLADVGGTSCEGRNEQWVLYLQGPPTGGSVSFPLKINGITSTITINFDDTALEIKALLEAHAEVEVGDVIVDGGPLPSTSIIITWATNLAKGLIPIPAVSISDLIGSGLGASLIRTERGFPNDFT